MEPVCAATIQDAIKAGRIVEARTLLTLHDGSLSENERIAFDLELTRLYKEGEALVARAGAMENEGRIEEAKALYHSVSLFAADFPGIQSHIKRLADSLLLTKAVQRRKQRVRQPSPVVRRPSPQAKKSPLWRAAVLAAIIATVPLVFFFLKNQPRQTIPQNPAPPAPVRLIPGPSLSPPETTATPAPAETTAAQPVSTKPADLPETKELQATLSPQEQPGERLLTTATSPPPAEKKDQEDSRIYTVQPGDSLIMIAQRQFCNRETWEKIHQLNRDRISDPDRVQPGMELRLQGIKTDCPPAQ